MESRHTIDVLDDVAPAFVFVTAIVLPRGTVQVHVCARLNEKDEPDPRGRKEIGIGRFTNLRDMRKTQEAASWWNRYLVGHGEFTKHVVFSD